MSKTIFYNIFERISLKVLDTGSLQIFLNPCKFANQLCQKKIFKCLSIFLGKMSLPQTVPVQYRVFFNFKFLIQIDPAYCIMHILAFKVMAPGFARLPQKSTKNEKRCFGKKKFQSGYISFDLKNFSYYWSVKKS